MCSRAQLAGLEEVSALLRALKVPGRWLAISFAVFTSVWGAMDVASAQGIWRPGNDASAPTFGDPIWVWLFWNGGFLVNSVI